MSENSTVFNRHVLPTFESFVVYRREGQITALCGVRTTHDKSGIPLVTNSTMNYLDSKNNLFSAWCIKCISKVNVILSCEDYLYGNEEVNKVREELYMFTIKVLNETP